MSDQLPPRIRSIDSMIPQPDETARILDVENCPTWVPGQLYIGGIGLAKGYWHDEERSRASFINHPRTGERLYRTGDLGRILPDGNIEFLGRDDLQVKIQGYRVELEEIEAVLGQHPGVRHSVVSTQGQSFGNRRLVAHIVPKRDPLPDTGELTRFLKERLPEYMVPASVCHAGTLTSKS